MPSTEFILCVTYFSFLLFYLLLLFLSTLPCDSRFPCSDVFLMTQILIFLKVRESLLCQYVLGFMFFLHDCGPSAAVRFFMALIFFIVAFSRANSAVEIEMTTLFSVSRFQVFIKH